MLWKRFDAVLRIDLLIFVTCLRHFPASVCLGEVVNGERILGAKPPATRWLVKQVLPGHPGRLPAPGSHRSGRADFPHPVLHVVEPLSLTRLGRFAVTRW